MNMRLGPTNQGPALIKRVNGTTERVHETSIPGSSVRYVHLPSKVSSGFMQLALKTITPPEHICLLSSHKFAYLKRRWMSAGPSSSTGRRRWRVGKRWLQGTRYSELHSCLKC